jgi:predicted DNA-binding transcriptional regulator AlpA
LILAEVAAESFMTGRAKTNRTRRRRADPNQQNLFDYVPPQKPILSVAPALKPSAASKGAKPKPAQFERAGLFTATQAAQYLNLSIWTLKDWRKNQYGPPHIKIGVRMVAHRPSDLDAFIASRVLFLTKARKTRLIIY